jgi:Ca2+-binding RTX toxin-like protein
LTVGAEERPASLYIHGTTGDDIFDKSASSYGWLIAGGNGDDTLVGGHDVNALNGGAGHDTIVGGSGVNMMTGGADGDTFVFVAGNLHSADAGAVDRITDFHSSGAEQDALRLVGFGAAATLTLSGTNRDGSFIYHVADGANSGDIVIQSFGHKLTSGDFLFV